MAPDVRTSLTVFPSWTQPFWTWLTGRALPGQRPWVTHTPVSQTVLAFVALFTGVAGAAGLVALGGWWMALLPIPWIVSVGAARKIQITICHGAVHSAFTKNDLSDRWLIEIFSTMLLIQDFIGYRRDHRHTHHGKDLATYDDPDVQFMISLGMRPGKSVPRLWLALLLNVVSPRFHLVFLYYRLKANFWSSPLDRRLLSVAWWSLLLGAVAWSGVWWTFLWAWIVPILFVYHVAALFQFTCEHYWLRVRQPDESAKIYLARLTSGRFMGQPTPSRDLPTLLAIPAWTGWLGSMLTYHLVCRVFVVVGDMPAHDWHHRYPTSMDWPNAIYARQQDIDRGGTPQWQEPYTEVWGLHNVIHRVFQVFSELPDPNEDERRMPRQAMEEVLRSM